MSLFGRRSRFLGVRLGLLWAVSGLLDLAVHIGNVFQLSPQVVRAQELIWGPVFGYFREKCERFLNVCNFALKKFEAQSLDFLLK